MSQLEGSTSRQDIVHGVHLVLTLYRLGILARCSQVHRGHCPNPLLGRLGDRGLSRSDRGAAGSRGLGAATASLQPGAEDGPAYGDGNPNDGRPDLIAREAATGKLWLCSGKTGAHGSRVLIGGGWVSIGHAPLRRLVLREPRARLHVVSLLRMRPVTRSPRPEARLEEGLDG
ncbi:hypothetical protein ACFVU3_28850 [Streptomyces sp. NPDC058052]|uniref:hypothetical protein n=1 Tax=Streptomyces sp. NPDC058052 TaxID=3346316 RepID=UPI0036E4BF9D